MFFLTSIYFENEVGRFGFTPPSDITHFFRKNVFTFLTLTWMTIDPIVIDSIVTQV